MNTKLASLLLAASLLLLTAPTVAAGSDDASEDEVHCALPTSWECIKAYGDMIFEEDDGVLKWACGFLAGEPCGPYGNDRDYVCHALTGAPCSEDVIKIG